MKNILQVLAILFAVCNIFVITSCGDDEADCSNPSDWVGTYTIVMGKLKKRHNGMTQTREPPLIVF